jgi:tRNA splicing endonuclease
MVKVFVSRFTPDLENGEDVNFNKGEKVLYKPRNEPALNIIIDSEYMQHESGYYGYEAIFSDNGCRCFAVSKGIVDWDGKVGKKYDTFKDKKEQISTLLDKLDQYKNKKVEYLKLGSLASIIRCADGNKENKDKNYKEIMKKVEEIEKDILAFAKMIVDEFIYMDLRNKLK